MKRRYPVIVKRPAKADVTGIRKWHDRQRADRPDLKVRFDAALVKALDAIASNPEAFAADDKGIRHARLTGTAYAAFFSLTPEAAAVFAILHLHQDPKTWQSRLPP